MAAKYDFTQGGCEGSPCEQGATFSKEIDWEVEQPDDSDIYVPVNISGFTARMQVRKAPGKPIIVELSTANGRIVIDGPNGAIKLTIDAATTLLIPAGLYRYDLDLRDSNGFVTRFVEGYFEVVGGITL